MSPRRRLLVLAAVAPLCALAFAPRPEPRWWKGNLHTHTLWSDGNDFPEMVVDWYRSRDYAFLALTEHNVIANQERWIENDAVVRRGGRTALKEYRERFGEDWVETRDGKDGKLEVRLKQLDEFRPKFEAKGEFALIQAEEITTSFDKAPIHLNGTNLAEVVKPVGGTDVRDVIGANLRAVAEQSARLDRPMLVHVNHPNFGWGITAEDLAYVPEEKFFEVYNGHPDVHHRGDDQHAGIERMWDIANTIRTKELGLPPLYGVATDDSHNYHNASGSTPGRGWVEVRAAELDAAALVNAMHAGDFYASSGVRLVDVTFDGKELRVTVDPVDGEHYRIDFVGTRADVDLASEPVVDAEGKALRVTRRYGDGIGSTLASVVGTRAVFPWDPALLYVRAVVTSDAAPENPVWDGQTKQAWTQPVGFGATR